MCELTGFIREERALMEKIIELHKRMLEHNRRTPSLEAVLSINVRSMEISEEVFRVLLTPQPRNNDDPPPPRIIKLRDLVRMREEQLVESRKGCTQAVIDEIKKMLFSVGLCLGMPLPD